MNQSPNDLNNISRTSTTNYRNSNFNFMTENVNPFSLNGIQLRSQLTPYNQNSHQLENLSFSQPRDADHGKDFLFQNEAIKMIGIENKIPYGFQNEAFNSAINPILTDRQSDKDYQFRDYSDIDQNMPLRNLPHDDQNFNSSFRKTHHSSHQSSHQSSYQSLPIFNASKSPKMNEGISPRIKVDSKNKMNGMIFDSSSPMRIYNMSINNNTPQQPLSQRDIRASNSYVNAMKALQNKIKQMEKHNEDKENEVQMISKEFEEYKNKLIGERDASDRIEGNLKNKIELLEKESNEKQILLETVNKENEKLKANLAEIQNEKQKEHEKVTKQKGNLDEKIYEFEMKLEEQIQLNNKLSQQNSEKEKMNSQLEADRKLLLENNYKLQNDEKEMKSSFEVKIMDIANKNSFFERRILEIQTDFEKELKSKEQKERLLYHEIQSLKNENEDFKGTTEELNIYLRDIQTQLSNKDNEIIQLKNEISTLKGQTLERRQRSASNSKIKSPGKLPKSIEKIHYLKSNSKKLLNDSLSSPNSPIRENSGEPKWMPFSKNIAYQTPSGKTEYRLHSSRNHNELNNKIGTVKRVKSVNKLSSKTKKNTVTWANEDSGALRSPRDLGSNANKGSTVKIKNIF